MIFALWSKTWRDSRWLLAGCSALLILFHFIRVWITSHFDATQVIRLLRMLPNFAQDLFALPLDAMASPAGRVGIAFDEPLVVLAFCIWGITRSSDLVSGELGRGSLEMLLAQPIKRRTLLAIHSAMTMLGLILLGSASWFGTYLGLSTFKLEQTVSAWIYIPSAINLACMGFLVAAFTSFCSSMDQYRWRTIAIAVGVYIVEFILRVINLTSADYRWVGRFTFLTLFDPEVLSYNFWPEIYAANPTAAWSMLIEYNAALLAMGIAFFLAAGVIFERRDLPAPI